MTSVKECTGCLETKAETEFPPRRQGRGGFDAKCRECHRIRYRKAYKRKQDNWTEHLADRRDYWARRTQNSPENVTRIQRDSYIKTYYGITWDEYTAKLDAQGGACANPGCRVTAPGTKKNRLGEQRFAIDHDHRCCPGKRSCGKCIRGLLCSRCNLLLGHADDNHERLLGAITYLERYAA